MRFVYRPNGLGHARLGLAVSRRFGSAVARNRFKRHAREIFRTHPLRGIGVDVLIIPLAGKEALTDVVREGLDVIASRLECAS